MTATLLLGEDVDLCAELRVRSHAPGFGENLPPLHLVLLGASQQDSGVVSGLGLVEHLPEHLDSGDDRLLRVLLDPDDLDLLAELQLTLLDAAGHDRASTSDREDVLDGHQERLGRVPLGLGDRLVDRCHQLADLARRFLISVESLEGRNAHDGNVVAGELVLGEQFAHLELHEVEELGVIDHVDLVERHDDVGNVHLTGEQHVLARLGHRTVGGGHHEDGSVHLGGAGDHVLDVVGVTRHVDVGVVPVLGLVLDVSNSDCDAALALLRSVVDLVERRELDVLVAL